MKTILHPIKRLLFSLALALGIVTIATPLSVLAAPPFTHPGVVYTQGDIDTWSTSSPEYTRLSEACPGRLDPGTVNCTTITTPVVFGTEINNNGDANDPNNELNMGLREQSGFAKIQAVLWQADGNPVRRDKVVAYLQEYRTVTSIEYDSAEQWRLVAGWSCTNLAQAAELIDYQDEDFRTFLRDVCYPIMDWPGANNWNASFADSKLAIAAYLGDATLWEDAKAYFYKRISQNIYHSDYDGNQVVPVYTEDTTVINNGDGTTTVVTTSNPGGTPNIARTQQTWGSNYDPGGIGQVNGDFSFNTADFGEPIDGMNAERIRDLAHVNFSLAAWTHGARTILAQGETLENHAFARLLAGYNYHAGRVLDYLEGGTLSPPIFNGDGGDAMLMSFYGARALFNNVTPSTVTAMLARADVQALPPSGALHMIAEAFADGTFATSSDSGGGEGPSGGEGPTTGDGDTLAPTGTNVLPFVVGGILLLAGSILATRRLVRT